MLSFERPKRGVTSEDSDSFVYQRVEWPLTGQRWYRNRTADLTRLLEDSQSDSVTKVLAANWLAVLAPVEARKRLVGAGNATLDRHVLQACLALLATLKQPGMERRAMEALRDASAEEHLRTAAACYVGTVKCAAAEDLLVSFAKTAGRTTDPVFAVRVAMDALAQIGDDQAVGKLIGLIGKELDGDLAHALVATGSARGLAVVRDKARQGSDAALSALAEAGRPEDFALFRDLWAKTDHGGVGGVLARGLASTGGDEATPTLLAAADMQREGLSSVVEPLVRIGSPAAVRGAVALAKARKRNGFLVLAGIAAPEAERALRDMAGSTDAKVRKLALEGLSSLQHAPRCFDVLCAALKDEDLECRKAAIGGLRRCNQPAATDALLPLVADKAVAVEAARALEDLPVGTHASAYLDLVLGAANKDLGSVTEPLARALVLAGWNDRSAVPRLAAAVRGTHSEPALSLLVHLAGGTLGPVNDSDYIFNKERYERELLQWADGQAK